MNLRNCPGCGKIFVYVQRNLCPDCIKKDEQDFHKVREYIHENPSASLEEVSEATEISTKRILEYLKEGRLMLKETSVIALQCEICEEPILTGRLCEKCSRQFRRGFETRRKNKVNDFPSTNLKGRVHLSKLNRDKR